MNGANVWDLSGFRDPAFAQRVLEWNGAGREKHPGSIFAMQELAPGVVGVRDADRVFAVVFDTNRWELSPGYVGRLAVTGIPPSLMVVETRNFPMQCRENFDDVAGGAQVIITPRVGGVDWHSVRQPPVLASQP